MKHFAEYECHYDKAGTARIGNREINIGIGTVLSGAKEITDVH
jgi:hypothetical protein